MATPTLELARSLSPQYARLLLTYQKVLAQAKTPQAAAQVTTQFQAAAVLLATATVAQQAKAQGLDPATVGAPNPLAWAGYTAGGALLTSYFTKAVTIDELVQMGVQQFRDVFKSAQQVTITATPSLGGYVRYLNPPSCARCVVLAGRFYREWEGWRRHTGCDCEMVAVGTKPDPSWIADPMEAFTKGQIRNSRKDPATGKIISTPGFSKADETAIRDGADIFQVVNSKRGGVQTVGYGSAGSVRVTTEGTTVRGRAYRGRTGRQAGERLTPYSIYRIAADREDAIRLLTLNGYIQ